MLINKERVKDYNANELTFCAKSCIWAYHKIKEYTGCGADATMSCSKCSLNRACEDIFDSYEIIRTEMERRRIDFSD